MNRNTPLRRHKPLQVRSQLHRTPMPPGVARKPRKARTSPAAPRPTGAFTAAVRLRIRTRAGNGDPAAARCEACAAFLGEHGGQIQHIYARGVGGSRGHLYRSAANGALLCGTPYTSCHGACEARDPHMYEAGFWRRRNGQEKPGDYPVMLHGEQGGRLVWLTALGGYSTKPPAGAHSGPLRHQWRLGRPSRCRIWPPAPRCNPSHQAGCRPRTSQHPQGDQ